MLYLIGLGLDSGDLSIKAAECLRNADSILYEGYTASITQEYINEIALLAGKEPKKITRTDIEDHVRDTVSMAKESSIAILFPGDPLVATTHHIIIEEARNQGISVSVVHAPSIFTAAIGESGLDIYKFGPTATIPRVSEKYKPTSFINVITKNLGNKQHTLILFDVTEEKGISIGVSEAIPTLLEAGKGTVSQDTKAVFMADIGRKAQQITYASLKEMAELSKNSSIRSACIVLPSDMSFAEKRAVESHSTSST
jgi:diphthine synthase